MGLCCAGPERVTSALACQSLRSSGGAAPVAARRLYTEWGISSAREIARIKLEARERDSDGPAARSPTGFLAGLAARARRPVQRRSAYTEDTDAPTIRVGWPQRPAVGGDDGPGD